ncbi:2-C-methyl-D-erythritol 4-phosphate cytidylyltransferase [Brevibacterium samyangense]|uniref:2-C-methyl-D-erythritol 4-phosphate cytidylyltransferase n=1 Tax=Brevibacterium samyangense TaxID=366888 RepID=A0ABP5F3R0_9MICO
MPKAFVPLSGEPLLSHCISGTLASGVATRIVVAVPEALVREARVLADRAARESDADPALVDIVVGGADRIESTARALARVPECEHVLVHDAARALTPPAVFHRVVAALEAGAAAVVPTLPVTDTVKRVRTGRGADAQVDPGTAGEELVGDLDRNLLRRIQTPQGFARAVLEEAHALQRRDPDPAATDDAGLVERAGHTVVGVPGDERALKITYPIDLAIAAFHLEEEPV